MSEQEWDYGEWAEDPDYGAIDSGSAGDIDEADALGSNNGRHDTNIQELLIELERDELTAELLCKRFGHAYPGIDVTFDSLLWPNEGKSAKFTRRPSDKKLRYVDDGLDEPMILVRLYSAMLTEDTSRLGRHEQLPWSVRMFVDIKHPRFPSLLRKNLPVSPPGCPDDVDRETLMRQLEGIDILEACRDIYSPLEGYPWGSRFGARWTGDKAPVVLECKRWFLVNHVLKVVDKYQYMDLYRLNR